MEGIAVRGGTPKEFYPKVSREGNYFYAYG